MATFNNHLAYIFATSGAVAKGELTPRSTWWLTGTVPTTVTTTVWVINSVHDDTTNSWADTHATLASGRTDLDVLVLFVTDNTDARHTLKSETADFA